jgi:ketosteroid isomerase-like protein
MCWRCKVIKQLLASIIIAAAVLPLASGHAQTKSDDGEQVKRLESERVKALVAGDVKTIEQVFADDLVYTHSNAVLDTKASFIESIKSGAVKYEEMSHRDVKARAYSNTVVLTGASAVRVRANGRQMSFQIRFTNVYVRRDGRWQMVAWQSSRLPQ